VPPAPVQRQDDAGMTIAALFHLFASTHEVELNFAR
jgi:hypothetical protein